VGVDDAVTMVFFVSISLLKQESDVIKDADEICGRNFRGHLNWIQNSEPVSTTRDIHYQNSSPNESHVQSSTQSESLGSLGALVSSGSWEPMRFYDKMEDFAHYVDFIYTLYEDLYAY
jgi:hypothetical protein